MELNNTRNFNQPDFLSVSYQAMQKKWELTQDLRGGTEVMRDARTAWLPQHVKEQDQHYENRLKRSFLLPGYSRALRRIVAKPFSKPISEKGELPKRLQPMIDDVDGKGQNLTAFGRGAFERGVDRGLFHILVDMPTMPADKSVPKEKSFHPNFVAIGGEQLIGTTFEDNVLSEIRFHEIRVVPKGTYGDEEVDFIRIYSRDGVKVFKRKDANSAEWVEDPDQERTFEKRLPKVPLVTFYTNRTGELTATPPLEDLAWVNLNHWQSSSDQNNVLSFARTGILFGKRLGVDKEGNPTWESLSIGPHQGIFTDDAEADLKIVEHSGDAIGAGRTDLEDHKAEMDALGLAPFTQRSGDVTATGRAIDEASSQTDIQAWIRGLEGVLKEAFQLAAIWVGLEIDEDYKLDINSDFGISMRAERDIKALEKAMELQKITAATYLEGLKRLGVFPEDFDVEDEVEDIEKEEADRLEQMAKTFALQDSSGENDDGKTGVAPPNPSNPARPPATAVA